MQLPNLPEEGPLIEKIATPKGSHKDEEGLAGLEKKGLSLKELKDVKDIFKGIGLMTSEEAFKVAFEKEQKAKLDKEEADKKKKNMIQKMEAQLLTRKERTTKKNELEEKIPEDSGIVKFGKITVHRKIQDLLNSYDKGEIPGYNPYAVPPNLDHASIHGFTKLAGNILNLYDIEEGNVESPANKHISSLFDPKEFEQLVKLPQLICPCCQRKQNGVMAPILIPTRHFAKYGPALPGLFDFVKFCLVILVSTFVVYSLYNIQLYARGNNCPYDTNGDRCGEKWKYYTSRGNDPKDSYDTIERILFMAACIVIWGIKGWYYTSFKILENKLNQLSWDITDFSVEVRGLPLDIRKEELVNFFHKQVINYEIKQANGETQKVTVKPIVDRINFIFAQSHRLNEEGEDITKLIARYVNLVGLDHRKDDTPYAQILQKDIEGRVLQAQNTLETKYSVRLFSTDGIPELFTGRAFVTFTHQIMKEAVMKELGVQSLALFVYNYLGTLRGPFAGLKGAKRHKLYRPESDPNNTWFYIEAAEKPADIIFTNLGHSKPIRAIRKAASFLLSVILIGLTFLAIFYLKGYQLGFKNDDWKTKGLVILITVIIKVVGFLFGFAAQALVALEAPETNANKNLSIIWRSTIGVFLNSAVVLVLSNIAYSSTLKSNFWTDSSVTNDLLFLLILSILEAFLSFIEPGFFIKKYQKWDIKSSFYSKGIKSSNFQFETNTIYEGAEFDFPRRYSKYLSILLITYFILPLFPLAPIYALIIITIYYWSDKIFLIKFAKVPEYNTIELTISMIRFIDTVILIWATSYVIFDTVQYPISSVYTWSWVTFGIAVFTLAVDSNVVLGRIFFCRKGLDDEKGIQPKDFREYMAERGIETYGKYNPVNVLATNLKIYSEAKFLMNIGKDVKDVDQDEDFEMKKDDDMVVVDLDPPKNPKKTMMRIDAKLFEEAPKQDVVQPEEVVVALK